jgi:uncharacterized protein (DUF1501 family)
MSRRSPLALSRRAALGLGAAGLMMPRFGVADAITGSNRRFLFIHCSGGWDTTYCFQPNFGSSVVDMEPSSVAAEVGGITFVDNEERPSVRAFFESYASRTAIVNGIEVPSITHERCRRIMMTGSAEGETDDWGALLAGQATSRYLLPYFVLSGTAFTAKYSSRAVRVGSGGQLTALLTGEALTQADRSYAIPSEGRGALVDAFVRARMGASAPTNPIATAAASALDDAESLRAYLDTLDIGSYSQGCYQMQTHMATVWDVFQLGLARTALIEYKGWCSEGWDTHSNNDRQALHFEELFDLLSQGIADLDTRTAAEGGALADETVVVVFSEMGRTPQLNGGNGRDHWTYTSAMVVGAGVKGGQVIGGFDDSGYGDSCDYGTGEVSEKGDSVHAANFGASLLALGDVDPGETAPITALLA